MTDQNKLNQALDIIRSLNTSEFEPQISTGNSIEDLLLEVILLKKQKVHEEAALEKITDYFFAISNGEFKTKAPVFEGDSSIDALGFAVVAFVEELQGSTISINAFDNILNSLSASFFIIDVKKKCLAKYNEATLNFFEYNGENLFQIKLNEIADEDFIENFNNFQKSDENVATFKFTFKEKTAVANFGKVEGNYLDRPSISVFIIDITAESEKEKLEESNEIITKSLAFRTQFLANMSHEIRTPLNGIVGLIDFLTEADNLPPELKAHLKIIQGSSDQLLAIVNDILNLSRLESGKLQLAPKVNYLPQSIEKGNSWFEARLKEKNIKLDLNFKTNYWKALDYDEARLLQIISNLMSNAVKFSPSNSTILFEINECAETEECISYKFKIKDEGKGISQKNQTKLFSLFGKVDDKDNVEGAGLGLMISQQLVKLFNGTIGVQSEEEKGASFWFTIPFKKAKAPAFEPIEVKQIKAASKVNLNALLVDDKMVNRTVAKLILSKLNFTVDEAKNGQEAYEKALENNYDVIFMDIQMPIMNGLESTKKIQAKLKSNSPLIVGLSANAMEGDGESYIQQGMDLYETKPITIEKITNLRLVIEEKIKK